MAVHLEEAGGEEDIAQPVVCPSTHADEHRPLKVYPDFNPARFD